jgi:hypothetical protein
MDGRKEGWKEVRKEICDGMKNIDVVKIRHKKAENDG